MIVARFYRKDLVTGEDTIEVDFSVIYPSTLTDMHEQAVANGLRRPNVTAYQIWEGNTLSKMTAVGLRHSLR